MSLQQIILGFLKNYGSLSGYDLKQIIDGSTRNFWYCDLSQIYRALSANEAAQWVTAVPDPSNNRNRITYMITETGEKVLQDWLEEDFEILPIRHPELARIFFGKFIPKEKLREQITTYQLHQKHLLTQYQHIKTELESQQSPKEAADLPYWLMTIERGILSAQAQIDWCNHVLRTVYELENQEGK